MVRVPIERLRPLVAELNALRSRFAAANQYAAKLTVEHNRLVAETDQMPAGIARTKRQEHAEQLLRRKIAAYTDEKRLRSAIATKEEEIADLISAMWAAATALNYPELSRRLQAAFTSLSDRVVKLEERLEKLDGEVTGLRQVTTGLLRDGEQVRETVVGLRADVARMSAVLSGVRGDIADARSVIGARIGDLAAPVGLQNTIVKHGWEPGLQPPTEPAHWP
jgi:chromosome segregation ATPase